MSQWLRFADLKGRGIVRSWVQLTHLQNKEGFPLGRLLSPNVRVWNEETEINPWLESRPVERRSRLRGAAKLAKDKRAAAVQTETSAS